MKKLTILHMVFENFLFLLYTNRKYKLGTILSTPKISDRMVYKSQATESGRRLTIIKIGLPIQQITPRMYKEGRYGERFFFRLFRNNSENRTDSSRVAQNAKIYQGLLIFPRYTEKQNRKIMNP